MTDNKSINLLVLPELFPAFEDDITGIFIEDYVHSVSPLLNAQTLYIRLVGKRKGVFNDLFRGKLNVRRVNITESRISGIAKSLLYLSWFVKGYRHGLSFRGINIIHAHGAVLNGLLAYLLSRKKKVPYIVTEHIGPYSRILNNKFKKTISKFVLGRADKVLVVSQHQKEDVLKLGIDEEKVEVSFNPVNTEIFKLSKDGDSKNIVFVSRLDEFKGGLRTLKAFNKIKDKFPEFNLIIVGNGEEYGEIENFIIKNDLSLRVTMKGTLTKSQIATVFSQSSFMVFPSRHETFGLVAAEALCCGLPVVCSNQTAPKEFIHKENGLFVFPDNIDEIANAMEELILNRSKYDGRSIHREIKEKFGLEKFGLYLSEVYKDVLGARVSL